RCSCTSVLLYFGTPVLRLKTTCMVITWSTGALENRSTGIPKIGGPGTECTVQRFRADARGEQNAGFCTFAPESVRPRAIGPPGSLHIQCKSNDRGEAARV